MLGSISSACARCYSRNAVIAAAVLYSVSIIVTSFKGSTLENPINHFARDARLLLSGSHGRDGIDSLSREAQQAHVEVYTHMYDVIGPLFGTVFWCLLFHGLGLSWALIFPVSEFVLNIVENIGIVYLFTVFPETHLLIASLTITAMVCNWIMFVITFTLALIYGIHALSVKPSSKSL